MSVLDSIQFYADPEDIEDIKENAEAADLSISAYIRSQLEECR